LSSTSTTLRARPARDPSPDAQHRRTRVRPTAPRPPLEVIVPTPSRLRRRALIAAAVLTAVGILFGLVLVHIDLTAKEMRLIHLQDQASRAQDTNLKLRLEVAELESPARIVATAQQLGMVPPPKITYLTAVPGSVSPTAGSPPISEPTPAEGLQGWAMTKRVATAP
jgi:cell division protein FtsL